MNFPHKARFSKVLKRVNDFFIKENIDNFPIDPFSIIKTNNWGVISYSELAKEHGVNVSEIVSAFQSEDGYTIYDGSNFTIAYNDTVQSNGRIRFTLMHEIGHIYMGHLIEFDETILRRSTLTEEKYKVLEQEANTFARNSLAPATVVRRLNLKTEMDIIHYFDISQQAAKVRLESIILDLRAIVGSVTRFQLNHFNNFINRYLNIKYCFHCYHSFKHPEATHCPVCGRNDLKDRKGFFVMNYESYIVDEIGRAIQCPVCDNEELMYDGDHCKICGTFLVNKCADTEKVDDYTGLYYKSESCHTTLDGNARFCVKCGNESTYHQQELLDDWKKEKEAKEALPF
ncbi:ImmA/IrrE family metallo-endopeptidase [Bacillus infantis]|uniref:ImmA/IrrE family metallo-endopeptidase n=1 Tax=Bacillus infantis TaxID=324767 RepID=UPI003982222B